MKKAVWFLAFVLAAAGLAPRAYAGKEDKDNWMYVINARAAELQPVKDAQGQYKLKLENISPQVLVFSERPNQEVDAVPAEKFFKGWQDKAKKFRKNPPHAALDPLVEGEGDPGDPVYLLNLQNPVYDSASKTIEFDAVPVSDDTKKPERLNHRKTGASLPASLHETAVFLDRMPAKL